MEMATEIVRHNSGFIITESAIVIERTAANEVVL